MKIINVGLIGLGTVGSGVYEIIRKNAQLIENRTGVRIIIKATCNRSTQKADALKIDKKSFTTNPMDIVKRKDIDVIVELIGGYDPAHEIIVEAIKRKKHVITANKAVLAKYGYEIFKLAEEKKVNILFEAAVGGCIPIIRTIEESYPGDKITDLFGILNGTTNFILTRMSEGMSYDEALKKAQQLGFAEADPTFDVEGLDASQKIKIAASLAFDAKITEEPLVEGITKITKQDIAYAKEMGYIIKLIAMARLRNDRLELRTHPTMIPHDHVLAGVNNEFNAFLFQGECINEVMLSGKGAGKLPTASVVVSDIIEMGSRTRITERHFKSMKLVPREETLSRYYLRLHVLDNPGVMSSVTGILGKNNVSISGVQQKEDNKNVVPVIILTHKAKEGNMMKAIAELEKTDIVKEKPVLIRIDELI